jgi:transposase
MSKPLLINVTESVETLRNHIKSAKTATRRKRLKILLVIKEAGEKGISKYDIAKKVKINHNSAQTWRTKYQKEGIAPFLSDARKGFKPSSITDGEHRAIEELLHNPKNGLRGYKELQSWYETTYGKDILYNTLLKYCIRHFKSSCKVARKSHIRKDEKAVDDFKKTLVQSATTSSNTKKTNTKK